MLTWMTKMDDFCVFILTHGRPDKVFTLKTIQEKGYTGKTYLVVDDEDKTLPEYLKRFPEQVLVFSKAEIVKSFDEGDNFGDRRAIIYARNACFELAKQVNCKYFIQLDDDYTDFRWSFTNERKYVTNKYVNNLDKIFAILLKFYKSTSVTTLSMAQGGDFIGGAGSGLSKTFLDGQISRKCMNSFICSTERPFRFMGRINEDVNTYCNLGNRGHILMTIAQLRLEQKQTQSNSGGMTELYLNSGTYVKSFYSVMYNPSSVKIRQMGQSNKRLHHSINWHTTVPKIISEKFKKYGATQASMQNQAVT
jgi:hypothetical protein